MSDLIDRAMKTASAAECYLLCKTGVEAEFENNKLKGINHGEISGRALRIVRDGRIGFSTSTREDDDESIVKRAAHVAKYGRPVDFEFSDSSGASDVKCFDKEAEQFPVEKMVDIGKDIINAIVDYDPDILAFASAGKSIHRVNIINSKGMNKEYKKSSFSIVGGGKITEEGNFLQIYDFSVSTAVVSEKEIEKIKKKVIEDFAIAKQNVPFTQGSYPVLLSPMAVGDLLTPVMVCSNGKSVQKGVSPWRDKIGEQVFDKKVGIYDDGTAQGGVASRPFDDEGIPTSPVAIIEKGVVMGFYHNLATASALKMKPTGNGLRGGGISNIPSPATTNFIMNGGDTPVKDMLRHISKGVFIDQLLGTFTGNHLAGQVSGNISLGYKIENGVKAGRIKNAMFSVNLFDVLKNNLSDLSKEVVWKGHNRFPYILLDDIYISAKG